MSRLLYQCAQIDHRPSPLRILKSKISNRGTRVSGLSRISPTRRRLRVEPLESRELMAGDVGISINDTSVIEGASAYRFTDNFVAPDGYGLAASRQLAMGPDGNVYVASKDTDSVEVFEGGTGRFVRNLATTSGELDGPWAITFGPDGGLYVVGMSRNVIRFDVSTGQSSVFVPAASNGGLQNSNGLSFGPDGNLYVSSGDFFDPTGPAHDSVLRFSGQTGQFIDEFVAPGSGGLTNPNGLVFGPDGNLYVTSTRTDSVLRYNGQSGAFLSTFVAPNSGGLDGPNYVTFRNDGLLYVASQFTNQILRYNASTGAFVDAFVSGTPITGFAFADSGELYVSAGTNTGLPGSKVGRYAPSSEAAFTVSLSQTATSLVSVDFITSDGSALAGSDYASASGTIDFAPGESARTILVRTLDDTTYEGNETITLNLSNPVGGVIADNQGVATIVDNELPPTKFYVVNDGSPDRTFEYAASGAAVENYALNSGNSTPRGAASTAAGDKVWVVDANKNVYVYNTSGGLLGSWSAGSLPANADVQGVTTNDTDVWIVDAKGDKVYRYTGAAFRLSGSQTAASSFSLNSTNSTPKDLVTDGSSIWVVNSSGTDRVFKYTVSGTLLGKWSIDTANSSPTGITIDPSNVSNIWIVDNVALKIFQYNAAASRTSGSQTSSAVYALSSGNTNPQGIADPPPASALVTANGPATGLSYDAALLGIVSELDGLLGTGGIKKRT